MYKLIASLEKGEKSTGVSQIFFFFFCLLLNGLAKVLGNDLNCILDLLLIMIKTTAKFNKIQLNISLLN